MRFPAWVSATETHVRKRTDAVQTWVERTIWWRVWERVLENEFVDRSVALAAKAFVSLFPAIIVVAAFAPASVRDSIYRTITHRAGLSGAGLATVRGAFASADDIRRRDRHLGSRLHVLLHQLVHDRASSASTRERGAARRPVGSRATRSAHRGSSASSCIS